MKRRISNFEYLVFQLSVKGYDFYYKNKKVPVFILYWRGYDSTKLIFNRTDLKVKRK